MLRFWSSKLHFWRKSRRKASFDKIIWITHHLTSKSLESQIQLTTKSFESQIDWQPNHLNLKSIDNQITSISDQLQCRITWISNQLTTKSVEVQVNRQPKSFEAHINWQPSHLTLNSFESDINWLSNQLNSAHPLPIGSLSLETSATASCGRYVKRPPAPDAKEIKRFILLVFHICSFLFALYFVAAPIHAQESILSIDIPATTKRQRGGSIRKRNKGKEIG